MKRAGLLLACVCVLGLGLVAAPAFSLRPYVPRAVDFEMAAPSGSGAVSAARARPWTSPVLRAPRRFDLVGMRWSSRGPRPEIWMRARKAGARWTRWVRVAADPDDAPDRGSREHSPPGFSAPLWTGEADYVQYRLSRRVSGLRLHFVNALGTASVGDRVKTALRRAVHDATMTLASLFVPTAAAQDSGEPAIQPRSAWGADQCKPRSAPEYGQVQAAFIHHTVTANDYTQDEVPAIILSICRYHRDSNGWNDIGYNFLVDKFGTLWEGRAGGVDQAVIGAQAQGYNSQTTGVADIGDHSTVGADDAELNAIAALLRWKLPLHGAPTQGTVTLTSGGGSLNRYSAGQQVTINRISAHRDVDSTACPGDALYAQLPDLRARVGNVVPNQARTLIESLSLKPAKVVYPAQATLSGRLRQVNGTAVAGAPLAIQAYGSSGWRTVWRATSGDDGSFSLSVGARLTHRLRVQYAGDAGRVGSTSPAVTLTVVPELSLERSAARKPVGQTVTLTGTVQPSKQRLVLLVERRAGKAKATGRLALAAKGGRFARSYRFHSAGLFRFVVAFKGDQRNAAATSAAVYVRALPGTVNVSTPNNGGATPGGGAVAARR